LVTPGLEAEAKSFDGRAVGACALRYRPRDLLLLARSPLGRQALSGHARSLAWPVLDPLASVYRRTLARRVRLVAVVGSFGKTTTRNALGAVLGTPRTHAGDAGLSRVPLSMLLIRPGQRCGVLEVQIDSKGQMARHARTVRPDVVVVTSIGSEHSDSLGSLDETLEEKAKILSGLRPDGLVVLNGDDPRVRGLAARVDARVLTFGMGEANDVRASELRLDWPHGTRFLLHVAGATREARLRLLGPTGANAALAAIAVAIAEGGDLEDTLAALERLEPEPGRMQPVRLPNGAWLVRDESKSVLETIEAALDVLVEIPARRIVVLGEITDPPRPRGQHYRRLGARLATIASRVIVVASTNSFNLYAEGALEAGLPRTALVRAGGVRQAAEILGAVLRQGDVVLLKGRGIQRFERIALALQGRTVGCDIPFCSVPGIRCEQCPMLERGWPDPETAAIVCAPAVRATASLQIGL
jgi:UDP-N-acetylmuramoyl-tripeptide--D-alanyl-D-alanine ligase